MTRIIPALFVAAMPFLPAVGLTFTGATLQAQGVDLDAIFNCSADGPLGGQTPEECLASRSAVLNNCTSCHTFVPIVKAQKSEDAWIAVLEAHRDRVEALSDADYEALGTFLRSHFNETEPVPVLPPALEALGTGLPA